MIIAIFAAVVCAAGWIIERAEAQREKATVAMAKDQIQSWRNSNHAVVRELKTTMTTLNCRARQLRETEDEVQRLRQQLAQRQLEREEIVEVGLELLFGTHFTTLSLLTPGWMSPLPDRKPLVTTLATLPGYSTLAVGGIAELKTNVPYVLACINRPRIDTPEPPESPMILSSLDSSTP